MGPPAGYVPQQAKFLGTVTSDPTNANLLASGEFGWWWFNTTDNKFKFWDGSDISIIGGTYTKDITLAAGVFGKPNTNPPAVIDQDNLTLYSFTVNTDSITIKWEIPRDYDSGDITIAIEWTNDGGVDDNGKNVKWQIDYQSAAHGEAINGSHANSPVSVGDTYGSASGWINHKTESITIPGADIAGKIHLYMKLSAVTAPATVLSCEPHFDSVHISYIAKRSIL